MKHGFTTGSCSAAASKAAAYMLLSGNIKEHIIINTPAGIDYKAAIEDITISPDSVSCAVRKDGGDDPDVTSGCLVYARVSYFEDSSDVNAGKKVIIDGGKDEGGVNAGEKVIINGGKGVGRVNAGEKVIIDGGKGVGRVTRKGLDQPVGNAAINSTPREMIAKEVTEVMDFFDYSGRLKVVISVPMGEEIALKTFNPRLGIEGGISIIGTTGIVEPMSTKAILDTIKVELNQKRVLGNRYAVVTPGNYGLEFMKEKYDFDLDKAVKCSNYIGETIDMIRELGYEGMLLTGHIGKLIKVSGGIMNTHSKEADCRMELMAIAAVKSGASLECVNHILDSLTTDEAYQYICNEKIEKEFSEYIMDRILFYLKKRAGDIKVDCIVYSNEYGILGATKRVKDSLDIYSSYN